MSHIKTGVVKFYDTRGGFGFIEFSNDTDAFVHVSILQDQRISFLPSGIAATVEVSKEPRYGRWRVERFLELGGVKLSDLTPLDQEGAV